MSLIYLIFGILITSSKIAHGGGNVRFRDGFNPASGRVEVKSDDGSNWGNICSASFDIIDADVICRQMNHAWALYVYEEHDLERDFVLWDLDCEGHESNIFDCEREETGPTCDVGVGIQCRAINYENIEKKFTELRLRSSTGSGENEYGRPVGKLEIKDNNNWKPICSDEWDIDDATVACRQLGFIAAVNYTTYDGPGSLDDIYTRFQCENEGYLTACEHEIGNCQNSYIFLQCIWEAEDYPPGEYEDLSLYYQWPNDDPCHEVDCNEGYCIIDEFFYPFCDCPPQWEGEFCQAYTSSISMSYSDSDNEEGSGNDSAPEQNDNNADNVIIYVAIGAGIFVFLVAIIIIVFVVSMMSRRSTQRSKARKAPDEIGLKGKPIAENSRNNNSYQPPLTLSKPKPLAQNTLPATDYYLEPSADYTGQPQVNDYTALASPSSEIYDEIPYDSIDNGGYMDLTQPSEYQKPPELPKPR